MAYDYSDLVKNTQQWAEQAQTLGWLKADVAHELVNLEKTKPDHLFSDAHAVGKEVRPLIVAFMGGTGVGKSTLLNRLAGRAIAKAGLERPTSREVTLYHHESISIQHFPDQFPLEKINIAQHDNPARKGLVWIDMPDFDSTEISNQQLVLQWLPHIDVLIYVVSPERYKDEKAWRILLAEGAKHAWLFVLNQWDRGQLGQFIDFNQQLHKAGFEDPVIYKTACIAGEQDEFASLEDMITTLVGSHVVEQLELRGKQLRQNELLTKLQSVEPAFGDAAAFEALTSLWQSKWQHTAQLLQQGFEWPIQYIAEHCAQHVADLLTTNANKPPALWDEWAQARFNDVADEFIIMLDQSGIPVAPFKQPIYGLREKASKMVQTQTEIATRLALANPGNALQRFFLKGLRVSELVLPLLAMSWVSYKVFLGYYMTNATDNHYLGVDFAIHSTLMIALTWLIPFFLLKKAQPSLKRSAVKGLNKGLDTAFLLIEEELLLILKNLGQQRESELSKLSQIIDQCRSLGDTPYVDQPVGSSLQRMLIKPSGH